MSTTCSGLHIQNLKLQITALWVVGHGSQEQVTLRPAFGVPTGANAIQVSSCYFAEGSEEHVLLFMMASSEEISPSTTIAMILVGS